MQVVFDVSGYDEVAGIRLPTKHRIFPRTPDGQSLAEPLIVSIDLSEIALRSQTEAERLWGLQAHSWNSNSAQSV